MKVFLLCAGLLMGVVQSTDDTTSAVKPVKEVAPLRLHVGIGKDSGELPLYVSQDWSRPQPQVTRALILFHGKLRNAGDYNRSGLAAMAAAGEQGRTTILVTPQFLAQQDVAAFHLGPDVLRWALEAWMGGEPSAVSAGISSFDGIDAILERLGDRRIFPNLKVVVVAGHSGGGQVVERYAVVGKASDALQRRGIHVRFVVANPSSYLYFSPDRPRKDGSFGIPAKSCYGKYNRWKYGVEDPPPYAAASSFGEYEKRFVRQDVIYLLGTRDTDPDHPALDKSCAAEDQGAFRYERGHNFFRYLQARHPDLQQRLWDVEGVAHDGDAMFRSPCGLAALFDVGVCKAKSASAAVTKN